MVRHNAKKSIIAAILFVLVFTSFLSLSAICSSCSKDDAGPTSVGCSDCGSGNVYWDSNAKRCRDRENGRFVKSCCCGH
jgi:DNA-directed RNA polymerase subunit M/transcription elongation factor TFIIS